MLVVLALSAILRIKITPNQIQLVPDPSGNLSYLVSSYCDSVALVSMCTLFVKDTDAVYRDQRETKNKQFAILT